MSTAIANTIWNIDPTHSHAEFKIRHMMISSVKGSFSGISGTLAENADASGFSRIDAAIEIGTLSSGDEKRDAHLKSAEFFDREAYPRMTFTSTKVEKKADGEYAVTGDLTLHGTTKPVTLTVEGPSLPAKDPWGNTRIGLSATTNINRKDFGLTWNAALESGGLLVGEEVQISLDVQFVKA